MPTGPIFVGLQAPAPPPPVPPAPTPTDFSFNYKILAATNNSVVKGNLLGVISEPVFAAKINEGSAALTLNLDHYPTEIAFGAIIQVHYPNGQVAGRWKYEGVTSKLDVANEYQITLAPLVSELTDVDFNANYSNDTTQPNPALGPIGFDVPVQAAILGTLHCTAGVVLSDTIAYSYAFNNAQAIDTLRQALTFGGSSWWWFCDHVGVVSLRNSSPYVHILNMGREVVSGQWEEDIHSLYNGQPVIGGTPGGQTTPITALATDLNVNNPYSVPSIGRRTAIPYNDTSILDQQSANAVAAALLGYAERVSRKKTLHITNYTVRRPQPGDAVQIREPDPDPTSATTGYSVTGPFLITEVTEYGATNSFTITVSADMTVPVYAINPTLAPNQAIAKLIQNPPRTALSPDGSTGTVGSGVLSGTGGPGYTAVPSPPVGVSGVSGIDILSQTNNAYVYLTWSPALATDVVVGYDVQWRKAGDSQWYTIHVGSVPAVKIPGLIPGFTYGFQVRAQNDLGRYSTFSSEILVVTGQDTAAPARPTGLTAYRTPRGALVQWNGNTEPDLQGYMLQVSIGGGPFVPANAAPNLHTSAAYQAPSGTPQQTTLVFQVAAVDWTGNQSTWSTASANVPTDGVFFDEVMTGNLTATGTITGGLIRTGTGPGARVEFDNAGIRLYGPSPAQDLGAGPGVTARLSSSDGSAFFSGTVAASVLQGPVNQNPQMIIDLATNQNLIVTDAGGIQRMVAGNIGGGNYGMIARDSTGAAIFDTAGLIKVMSVLGSRHYNIPLSTAVNLGTPVYPAYAQSMSGTGNEAVSFTDFGFTVPRTGLNILIMYDAVLLSERGNASYQIGPVFKIQIDGVGQYDYTVIAPGAGSSPVTCAVTLQQVVSGLAQGSYAARIVTDVTSGGWYISNISTQGYCYLLGTYNP